MSDTASRNTASERDAPSAPLPLAETPSGNETRSKASDLRDIAPDQPFAEGARDELDPDLRHRLISEAAYRHYVGRGYADGYDLDDWLEAEAEVDHLLLNPRFT